MTDLVFSRTIQLLLEEITVLELLGEKELLEAVIEPIIELNLFSDLCRHCLHDAVKDGILGLFMAKNQIAMGTRMALKPIIFSASICFIYFLAVSGRSSLNAIHDMTQVICLRNGS